MLITPKEKGDVDEIGSKYISTARPAEERPSPVEQTTYIIPEGITR